MTTRDSSELYGLILAGGRSSRMGFDKGLIKYHQNLPQREYLYKIIDRFCAKTFLGLRQDQANKAEHLPVIPDHESYQGPFSSILAAHLAYPQKAWLIIACDLPFITSDTLEKLVRERDSGKLGTAYYNAAFDFPEPLLSIWEPKGLKRAKAFAEGGNMSPARFLKGTDYKKVLATNEQELMNANLPEEFEQAEEKIRKKRN